jgi:hypothetical protein
MTPGFKLRAFLMMAFFSVSCVGDGYAPVGGYDDEEEEDDDDEEVDSDSLTSKDAGKDSEAKSDDAGSGGDAGAKDGGAVDARVADGGGADSGERDAGDAGRSDAGNSDEGDSCDTLTYEEFGEQFMASYCVGCHGPTVAQANIKLDSLAGVVMRKAAVKSAVASGAMPQGSKKPSAAEKEQLGQWIDCGPE